MSASSPAIFGGTVDSVLMRITDIAYAIPFLPFMIVLIGFVDNRLATTIAAMALVFWRTAARVVRAQVLTLKQRQYVTAARGSGAGHLRIMFRHILPHVLPLSLLYVVFGAAWAILTESSLSFLGLGDPDALSWGLMLNQAFDSGAIRNAWWWVLPARLRADAAPGGDLLVGPRLRDARRARPRDTAVGARPVRPCRFRDGGRGRHLRHRRRTILRPGRRIRLAARPRPLRLSSGLLPGAMRGRRRVDPVSRHRTARAATARDEPAAAGARSRSSRRVP